MWLWTLNWGEIRHDLVIGSCPFRPADIDRLHDSTGVTAVLSVQTDDCLLPTASTTARSRTTPRGAGS